MEKHYADEHPSDEMPKAFEGLRLLRKGGRKGGREGRGGEVLVTRNHYAFKNEKVDLSL